MGLTLGPEVSSVARLGRERKSVADVIAEQAERFSDRTCVTLDDVPITYREMHDRSNALASSLAELGVGWGDRVATILDTCGEALYSWFGAATLGAIEVAINPAYRGEFLRHQLARSEAEVVVVEARLADAVFAVAEKLPSLRTVVIRGDLEQVSMRAPRQLSVVACSELLSGDKAFVPSRTPRWDDPLSIMFTGGTTGPSKGAVVTHNQLLRISRDMSDAAGRGPGDVMYSSLPLFHLNAKVNTILGPIVSGGTGVLDNRFSVSKTWDRVRQYEATGISILGSMVMMLWNLPADPRDAELPINCIIGVPIPAELHRAIEERYDCRLVVVYGLSETGPLTMSSFDAPAAPGSSGRICPVYDVKILDENDDEAPVGDVGEIACRPLEPKISFTGYFKDPEATLESFRNLWFHTGDLGRFDKEGNLFFVDRKTDSIRRRGENISSVEVEEAVRLHPAVADVAAHAIPSPFTEDDVKLCVVVRPGEALSHEELLQFCVDVLPFFAVPRYIEFLDEIPQSPSVRPLKYMLRDRGVTEETWDREAAGIEVKRN
jgi:crotonobetaine/carnitine-CoA ligase